MGDLTVTTDLPITTDLTVTVALPDTAADAGAVALLAPLGIDIDFHRFAGFEAPEGWTAQIVAEERTGQYAALLRPPHAGAPVRLRHRFAMGAGRPLPAAAYVPEDTAIARAAAELAAEARRIAEAAGGGAAGVEAIVADAAARFTYGAVPRDATYYHGQDAIPIVACGVGNCIDINAYLVAGLRAAGYETTYMTCYYVCDDPTAIASGMHCWVRTREGGVERDWDIAHFKKVGREDVHAALNPVPGTRVALAYGRDHVYRADGMEMHLHTPSVPVWVLPDGSLAPTGKPTVTFDPAPDAHRSAPDIAAAE